MGRIESGKWRLGDKAELARRAKVPPSLISDILNGRRSATKEQAPMLVQAGESLGLSTSLFDWLYPEKSVNPLFRRG